MINPRTSLMYVVDPYEQAAEECTSKFGVHVLIDPMKALQKTKVAAVRIASAAGTHDELSIQAAAASKAIFCEKPIDLDIGNAKECVNEVERI